MLRTLRLLMRASTADAEERLIDANGTKLLAQHLREANADIKRGRHALAELVARQKAEVRRIDALAAEIVGREQDGKAAHKAGNEALTGDISAHIITLEDQRGRAEETRRELDRRIGELRDTLAQAERRLAALAADLRAARAGEIWRKSRTAFGESIGATPLEEAEALSRRIKETGQHMNDRIAALAERPMTAGEELDRRLDEAGLDRAAEARRAAVLKRFTRKD